MRQAYRTWAEPVQAALRGRRASPADAEDICHDAFLALIVRIENSPHDWERVCNDNYLFAIAYRILGKHLANRAVLSPFSDPGSQSFSRGLHPEDRIALQEALDRLPARCREAVELVRLHGLRYDEAAARMNIRPKTVDNHLRRAESIWRNLRRRGPRGVGNMGPGGLLVSVIESDAKPEL